MRDDKDRQRSRLELEHALRALTDWQPDKVGGPAVVLKALKRRDELAADAFRSAAYWLSSQGILSPQDTIAGMEKLAPVMLELLEGARERALDSLSRAMSGLADLGALQGYVKPRPIVVPLGQVSEAERLLREAAKRSHPERPEYSEFTETGCSPEEPLPRRGRPRSG